ncbi:MAG: hypothetical protein K1X66_08815 [Verrucomicrobiae bacterium]|nr:hypothetical protein [Verrucomicrobiae bacterium]
MKRFIIVFLVILGLVGFLIWEKNRSLNLLTDGLSNSKETGQSASVAPKAKGKEFDESKTRFALKLVSEIPSSKLSQENKINRLRLMPHQGCILGEKGKIIWKAPEGKSVYGMDASPSENKVLIDWGDAQYEVLSVNDSNSLKLLNLPSVSSIDERETEKVAFVWFWLDDDHLLGETGVWKPLAERYVTEETSALAEEDNVKQTLLYLFDTKNKKLIKIETKNSGLPPVFEIEEIRKDLIKVRYDDLQQEEKTFWTYLVINTNDLNRSLNKK